MLGYTNSKLNICYFRLCVVECREYDTFKHIIRDNRLRILNYVDLWSLRNIIWGGRDTAKDANIESQIQKKVERVQEYTGYDTYILIKRISGDVENGS